MKKIFLLLFAVAVPSCNSIPVGTKAEALQKVSDRYVVYGNYADIATFWDLNYEKCSVDYKNVSQLEVDKANGNARITFIGGAIYGIIDLKQIDKNKTNITVYSWGALPCVDDTNIFLKENFEIIGG